jgi:uncharacterized membrane protein YadS
MPVATRAFGHADLTPVGHDLIVWRPTFVLTFCQVMARVESNTAIIRRQIAFIKCYSVIIMIVLAGYGGTVSVGLLRLVGVSSLTYISFKVFGITLGSKWAKQSQLKQSNPGSHTK